MIRAPISSARSTWWRSPSGRRMSGKMPPASAAKHKVSARSKPIWAVFAFDPHRFKTDLRRQRDEQGRGAVGQWTPRIRRGRPA